MISNLSNAHTSEGGTLSISSQNASDTNTNAINNLSWFKAKAEMETVIDNNGKTM